MIPTERNKPVVLITGASSGIGKSICEIFFEAGYQVLGVDRQAEEGLPYDILSFDISRLVHPDTDCEIFFQCIEEYSNGCLNALINNAAVQIIKPIEVVTAKDWADTLDTNLLAPFWLIQRFLPLLREVKGSVVNIASIHAMATKSEFSLYATSKGALVTLTKALAIELAPDVRVNTVLPAATDTPMLRGGFVNNPDGLTALANYYPLRRIAKANEIAETVLFLSGPLARFTTGATINIDGGIGACLHDPAS